MLKYILKRILQVIPVILGVMLIVFMFQAISPDDPVDQILTSGATQEQKDALRDELGLNDPIVVQFGRYVWNFVTKGDLGTSYTNGRSIMEEIGHRFPTTCKLAFSSIILGILIGVPLGVIAAVKQYKFADSAILTFAVLANSMPSFWLALELIVLFSVILGLVPTSGVEDPRGWILPITVAAVSCMSYLIRMTRSSMLESIRQDYVRTARAKGQRESVIILRHVLRNSLIPIVAAIGNSIGYQLGGTLVIESIFGISGIGKYAIDAITARNYPAVRGSVVILAIVFTLVNLIVDLMYSFVDPRVKATLIAQNSSKGKKAKKQVAKANGEV